MDRKELEKNLEPLDTSGNSPKALALRKHLEENVINQHRAINCLVNNYEFMLSGLSGSRPIPALFLGPSGSGKTLIVQALSEYFFGSRDALTKIDGSDFKDSADVSKLIGASPKYVGYGDIPVLAKAFDNISSEAKEEAYKCRAEYFKIFQSLNYFLEEKKAAPKKYENQVKKLEEDISETENRLNDPLLTRLEISNLRENLRRNDRSLADIQKKYPSVLSAIDDKIRHLEAKRDKILEECNKQLNEKFGLTIQEFNIETGEPVFRRDKVCNGIILFDELDKSDHSAHEIFLTILDTGKQTVWLPKANGGQESPMERQRVEPTALDFKDFFIIFTANFGADQIGKYFGDNKLGFNQAEQSKSADEIDTDIYKISLDELKRHIHPPLLGRIGQNQIEVFRPLQKKDFADIFDLEMKRGLQGFTGKLFLEVWVYQEVKDYVVHRALKHKEYGARSIRTLINDKIFSKIGKLKNRGLIDNGTIIVLKLGLDKDPQKQPKFLFYANKTKNIVSGEQYRIID